MGGFSICFSEHLTGHPNYLDRHKGLAFVRDHYEVMHTLDFDYAIQDVQEVCQMNGGRL